uniref:Zinc finger CCCH domain-containing protein 14 n=1 Tax=Biomphalaria glabrata TaxID=6526 RepID=A0A2C9KAI7_BIOGL
MEVSTEISQKIRSAIKAKLMELGAYVDDELPDYIMVMVANKKSRSQMSSDLCLFLGTNTDAFTGWLHGLLGKLQTITVESSDKLKTKATKERKKDKKEGKDKKKSKKHNSESSKKKNETSDKNESSSVQLKPLTLDKDEVETNIDPDKDINLKSKPQIESDYIELPHESSKEVDVNKTTPSHSIMQEDVEDVRQLLVTGAQADELAEELETTEEEVKKSVSEDSKVLKLIGSNKPSAKVISAPSERRSRSPTPDKPNDHLPAVSRKRKIPTSVVAHVSKKSDNDEEEYDPYNPAVGSVASVVKVTSRRSSVPASLQANRALLLKAMSEAEKSIAVKRKVAATRPISRRDSPNEYSPKRKRLDPSPPPYIPSRKEASSGKSSSVTELRHLSHNDARHTLGKDKKGLTSRSRREEQQRAVEHERNVSTKSDSVHTSEKSGKETKETYIQIERQVKGDADIGAVKNFQITARVVSPKDIKVEREDSSVVDVKSSVTSRLGKVIVKRRPSDVRNDIQLNKLKLRPEEVRGRSGSRVISRLGKAAVQKQCEAAVQSLKSSIRASDKAKVTASPDSRVVCCDNDTLASTAEEDVLDLDETRDVKTSDAEENMSDDLAQMLDDDLEPEMLDQHDEFTLDLEDDDITNVVGEIDEEDMDSAKAVGKVEDSKAGTRFIVTLDGVDERQFDVSDSRQAHPGVAIPLQAAETQKEKLLLDLLTAQTRSALQQSILPLTQVSQVLSSKMQPPRIQQFSINLRDSDDEHEDKDVINKVTFDQNPENGEDNLVSALKKAKMSERCKFWPACAAGAGCEYHHPTMHCKTFPNCKFGDKCLFIHPNCKFDSKCSRPDCPFTHTSRRPNLSSAAHVITIPQPHVILSTAPPPPPSYSASSQVTCRYFPNCYNINCVFLHPKPCRFGSTCKNSTCTFYHPPLPGRSKLKWQAKSETSKTKQQVSSVDNTVTSKSTVSPSHSAAVSSTSQ